MGVPTIATSEVSENLETIVNCGGANSIHTVNNPCQSRAMEVAVLGFGLAGVLAAGFLLEGFPGAEMVAFDKSRRLGGLLSSAEVNGFTFDTGGSHVIFSNDKAVLAEIGLTWRGLRRRRWRAFWSWAWRGSGMCCTWRLGSTETAIPSTRWTTPRAATL